MSARIALFVAAVALFIAVAAGAFGAHTLGRQIGPERLAVWQTAVQYHAWHGLALFGVGLLMRTTPAHRGLAVAGWLFIAGIALFSGSLYLLAATGVTTFGFITPVGGVAFLAGWAMLGWAVLRA
ncbi:MAG TPA: DUF423 domain-containing protein [Casimicrobiaceae bacterium]|nr:DUF423 domain-containing protein [Casimicrobiaceae bacterium]